MKRLLATIILVVAVAAFSSACSDRNSKCPQWANRGECWSRRSGNFMVRACRLSCEACSDRLFPVGRCRDTIPQCEAYASDNACTSFPKFMQEFCPVQCGTCLMRPAGSPTRLNSPRRKPRKLEPRPPLGSPRLTFGQDDTPPASNWSEPALLTVYRDHAYGTRVRRLTDAGSRFKRTVYSRTQPENADGSLVIIYGPHTLQVVRRSPGRGPVGSLTNLNLMLNVEPQWHPTNPGLIRHLSGDSVSTGSLKYFETNVFTGRTREIGDWEASIKRRYPTASFMSDGAEGSPSGDGNRLAVIVYSSSGTQLAIAHLEISTKRLLGIVPVQSDVGPLDWVSSTPSGTLVVAGYHDATVVFNQNMRNARRVNNKAEHSDIAILKNGHDVYVYIDFSDIFPGFLVSIDLVTLEKTKYFDIYDNALTSMHISGKGFNKPGWVVVSTYNCREPVGTWSCDKLMAVELAGAKRILNLAHTYNCGVSYFSEPHASVNKDFSRVYSSSNSNSCAEDQTVYEITVPDFD